MLTGTFIVYGSLIRIPGGSLSDRFGSEDVGIASFAIMVAGAGIVTFSTSFVPAFVGMMVLGTGMGVANAAVFELVPKYVPNAVGGASGWIGGNRRCWHAHRPPGPRHSRRYLRRDRLCPRVRNCRRSKCGLCRRPHCPEIRRTRHLDGRGRIGASLSVSY